MEFPSYLRLLFWVKMLKLPMFQVYAVRIVNGEKHRHFLDVKWSLDEAKHLANCATCGNADYAYVKQMGQTVFFIDSDRPDYRLTNPQATIRPPKFQASEQ